jgi:hypothetical protein
MLVAVVILTFVATLVSTVWSTFGSPISKVTVRGIVVREAQFGLTALARDLDGRLDNPLPLAPSAYSLVGRIPSASAPSWRVLANPSPLQLCFDNEASPDGIADWGAEGGNDTVVTYSVSGDMLVRYVENGGPTTVVARKVHSFVVTTVNNQGSADPTGRWLQIDLTLEYGTVRRLYRMVAYGP